MKLFKLVTLIFLMIGFQNQISFACKYNVRETGFVNLNNKPYYFYGYFSENTPEDIINSFKQITATFFLDCNIKAEIVNTDLQQNHPAIKYLDLWQIQSFPSAVLVSPDGQSIVLPIKKAQIPFKQTLLSALENVVSSQKRIEIIKQVIKNYGVILHIEGTDVEMNKRAKKAISDAIEKIKFQLKMMPKTIAHPPVLISMSPESFPDENILLWSLGLEAEKIKNSYAVVLYGRTRWLGPLLKDEEISETNLTAILYIIGEDCECGIDPAWIQGTMLPVKWNDKLESQVANAIGFDPENPMVKMEMSRILHMGFNDYPRVPLGYQKSIEESVPTVDDSNPFDGESVKKKPVYLLAGLIVFILIMGLGIVLRAKRTF